MIFIIFLSIILIFLLHYFVTKDHEYFEKRGIKYVKPLPILGSNWRPAFGFQTYFDHYQKLYLAHRNTDSLFGTFDLTKPVYLVNDLELVKQITVKGFDHFVNRRISIDVNGDPVGGRMLAFMHGNEWRNLRGILSPAFTGNKMRYVFNIINDCAKRTTDYLFDETSKNGLYSFEAYTLFTRLTNDLIASTAFGIEVDSFRDNKNEFYTIGTKLNDFSLKFFIKWMLFSVAPNIAKVCHIIQ